MADHSEGEMEVKEAKEVKLPEAGALAKAWEAEPPLRYRVLDAEFHCLTRWTKPTTVGQGSVANMKLNTKCLEVLAELWVGAQDYPRAIPIDFLRKEACMVVFALSGSFTFKSNIPTFVFTTPMRGY